MFKGQCDVLRMVDLKSCRTYRQLLKQHQQTSMEMEHTHTHTDGKTH